MKKEYVTFVNSLENLLETPEVELVIKDLTPGPEKYDARYVKARVFSSPERVPDSDVLWVRSPTGMLYAEPLAIKIIQELEEFPK
jgi:hypothetical protein